MKKCLVFLGVLLLALSLAVGIGNATLWTVLDPDHTYIDYQDESGASVFKIDDDDGVTITGGFSGACDFLMATTKKVQFYDTGLYIHATGDGALKINSDGTLAITATTKTTFTGAIDVGVDGTGYDVTFYGDTASYKVWFDQDGDTNAAWYFGADDYGVDVEFFGQHAGDYMLWDASANKLVINIVDESAASKSAITADATIDGALGYYYGIQSNIAKSGTDGIDDCTAVTAYINQTTGAFTLTGRFAPLQAILSGSGTVGTITKSGSGAVHAAWIANRGTQTNTDSVLCVHNQSAATATSAIELDIDGTITYAFDFGGTVSDGWTSGDAAGVDFDAQDEYVLIPVQVDGVTPTLYILAAETYN